MYFLIYLKVVLKVRLGTPTSNRCAFVSRCGEQSGKKVMSLRINYAPQQAILFVMSVCHTFAYLSIFYQLYEKIFIKVESKLPY